MLIYCMQPKVELNRVRDVEEIINDSFLFFKQNWKPLIKAYFTICGLFLVAGMAASVLNEIIPDPDTDRTGGIFNRYYLLGMIFSFLGQVLVQLLSLSYVIIYKEKGNQPADLNEVWAYVKFYFFRVFFASLICTVIVVIGVVCCIIPGIYFYPVCSFMIAIMVLENTTFGYAFDRAFALIKNNWWQVFGALFFISVIIIIVSMAVIIPAMAIAGIYSLISSVDFHAIYRIPLTIATHLIQVIYVIPVIGVALCFYSSTEQKEDTSLLLRIEAFGNRDAAAKQHSDEDY